MSSPNVYRVRQAATSHPSILSHALQTIALAWEHLELHPEPVSLKLASNALLLVVLLALRPSLADRPVTIALK